MKQKTIIANDDKVQNIFWLLSFVGPFCVAVEKIQNEGKYENVLAVWIFGIPWWRRKSNKTREKNNAWTIFLCPDCRCRCSIRIAAAILQDGRPICNECFKNYSDGGGGGG